MHEPGTYLDGARMTTPLLISILAALGTLVSIALYRVILTVVQAWRNRDKSFSAAPELELPLHEETRFRRKEEALDDAEETAKEQYENGQITHEQLLEEQDRLNKAWVELQDRRFQAAREYQRRRAEAVRLAREQKGRMRAWAEDVYKVLDHTGFRVLVATLITVFALPVSFYVVLGGPKFDATAKNFATGTIGAIIGFWLKP
jgi:hypothetical protein